MKTFLVFVYGSLLRGLHNYQMLQTPEAKFIRRDSIRAKIYTSHWGWPFMVFSQSSEDRLLGEVYEVSFRIFKHLDSLEGYHPATYGGKDCLFIRKQAHTKSGLVVYAYEGGLRLRGGQCYEIKRGVKGVNWRAAVRTITIWTNKNIKSTDPLGQIRNQSRELAIKKFIIDGHAIWHPRATMSWYEVKREQQRSLQEGIVLRNRNNFTGMIKIKKTPGCDLKNAMVDQISGNTPHPF